MKNETVELKDLVGKHYLSGVSPIRKFTNSENEDSIEGYAFILDDITYECYEDPSDGYRSFLSEITVSDKKLANTFPPQEVYIVHKTNGMFCGKDNILLLYDTTSNKVVLEIGTADIDDYYPSCRMFWHPQYLSINMN